MKKNFIYLGIILCVGLLEVACEKQEPVHYENNPGLYFYKRTIQGLSLIHIWLKNFFNPSLRRTLSGRITGITGVC